MQYELPPRLAARVDIEARRRGVDCGEIISEALEWYLAPYYDKHGFKTVDYVETVASHLEAANAFECHYETWHVCNALKYALRAGFKDGEDWRDNAKKCADFLCRFKTGRFTKERREDLMDGYCGFTD